MSKDIWHTVNENPDANVGFACYRNLSHVENCTYLQNGGFQPTGSWAYIKDLLALETELERTRKALGMALDWLEQVATSAKCDDYLCREFTKRKLAEIKTALEQKEE